jgi:hypothetical protein
MSGTMVCNKIFLTRVVLWARLRVSFNVYVDPLFEFQVIHRALTRLTNDMMILYYFLMTKVDRS